MTDRAKRLTEIEAREKAATPGPWGVDAPYDRHALDLFAPDRRKQPTIASVCTAGKDLRQCAADFDFMAEARQDVPWLLAEIRDADAALSALGVPDDGRSLAERIKSLGETREDAVCT